MRCCSRSRCHFLCHQTPGQRAPRPPSGSLHPLPRQQQREAARRAVRGRFLPGAQRGSPGAAAGGAARRPLPALQHRQLPAAAEREMATSGHRVGAAQGGIAATSRAGPLCSRAAGLAAPLLAGSGHLRRPPPAPAARAAAASPPGASSRAPAAGLRSAPGAGHSSCLATRRRGRVRGTARYSRETAAPLPQRQSMETRGRAPPTAARPAALREERRRARSRAYHLPAAPAPPYRGARSRGGRGRSAPALARAANEGGSGVGAASAARVCRT